MTHVLFTAAAVLAGLLLAASGAVFHLVFYNSDERKSRPASIPDGEQYSENRRRIARLLEGVNARPYEEVWIRSRDGLPLYGRYYEIRPGAPTHIQFHGYRGAAVREYAACRQCEWELGVNTLLVDERAHGRSGGHVTTFGIRERGDVLAWAEYAARRFGPDCPLILSGVSMGAAAVLMAADLPLPGSVRGLIADSPYDSPKDIICTVIRDRRLPVRLLWPLVYLGGLLYGGVNLKEASALTSLQRSRLPVLIYHGTGDAFVPCEMSVRIRDRYPDRVQLEIFPGAAHGISYLSDSDRYVAVMRAFMRRVAGASMPGEEFGAAEGREPVTEPAGEFGAEEEPDREPAAGSAAKPVKKSGQLFGKKNG
ncbi:MAG: alpha/beta hydrolase [Anaerovoracaceae bacterium]|jgi:alpha-beta hydrolase superfamily lysophospholipase